MKDQLKIGFLLVDMGGGGMERSVITLANEFQRRGHDTSIVLERKAGPLFGLVAPGIRIVDLGNRRRRWGIFHLRSLLRRERFDFFFSGTENLNAMTMLARLLAGRGPTRFILVERTSFRNYRSMHRSFLGWLLPLLYPFADHIITLSRSLEPIVTGDLRCRPEKVTTIPNAFELAEIEAGAAEPPPHPWLRDGGAPVIVASGRLRPVKDFTTLIRAFAILRRTHAARLIIIGEGPERESLQRTLADAGLEEEAALPGFAVNPFAFYANANLFVLSSVSESFSRVVVEALACGIPVVATDCGGPGEILESGRYGRLVPVADAEAMAAAMAATLDNPPPRDLMQGRAAEYSVEAVTDAYLALMSRLSLR